MVCNQVWDVADGELLTEIGAWGDLSGPRRGALPLGDSVSPHAAIDEGKLARGLGKHILAASRRVAVSPGALE